MHAYRRTYTPETTVLCRTETTGYMCEASFEVLGAERRDETTASRPPDGLSRSRDSHACLYGPPKSAPYKQASASPCSTRTRPSRMVWGSHALMLLALYRPLAKGQRSPVGFP